MKPLQCNCLKHPLDILGNITPPCKQSIRNIIWFSSMQAGQVVFCHTAWIRRKCALSGLLESIITLHTLIFRASQILYLKGIKVKETLGIRKNSEKLYTCYCHEDWGDRSSSSEAASLGVSHRSTSTAWRSHLPLHNGHAFCSLEQYWLVFEAYVNFKHAFWVSMCTLLPSYYNGPTLVHFTFLFSEQHLVKSTTDCSERLLDDCIYGDQSHVKRQ